MQYYVLLKRMECLPLQERLSPTDCKKMLRESGHESSDEEEVLVYCFMLAPAFQ